MRKQTDIPELLKRVEKALNDAKHHRGTAEGLIKAAPLELHLYNLATCYMNELKEFRAVLLDAGGSYEA